MSYSEQQAHIELLLIKRQLGEISPEELASLETSLQADEEAQRQHSYLETTAPETVADIKAIQMDEMWQAFQNQLTDEPKPATCSRRIRPYSIVAAAAILAVVLLALNHFFFHPSDPVVKSGGNSALSSNQVVLHLANGQQVVLNQTGRQDIQAGNAQLVANNKTLVLSIANGADNAWNTLEVPRKLDYKVNLPDGSTVHLNSATKLKFPFAFKNGTREVYVEGEAYFIVEKKADQPFIVHTLQGDIQVLGTEFNVNTYTDAVLKTALIKGVVKVTAQKKSTILKPGDDLTLTANLQILTSLDSKSVLSWKDGVYYFRNTPFKEIAAMIPRWFDVKVVIDNEDINEMPFTGQLNKSEPLDNFLKPIQYTAGIEFYYKDDVLHISR